MNVINFTSNIMRRQNCIKTDVIKILKKCASQAGLPGSGAGRGFGAGGVIKEGGGGLGMMGSSKEDEYFYDKQRQLLQNIKKQLDDVKEDGEADQQGREKKLKN